MYFDDGGFFSFFSVPCFELSVGKLQISGWRSADVGACNLDVKTKGLMADRRTLICELKIRLMGPNDFSSVVRTS